MMYCILPCVVYFLFVSKQNINSYSNTILLPQDHPGKSGNTSKDPSSDYQEGATHVFSVIHDILAQHRALEAKWHAKKIKLHQRLALRLFQEDVKQVSYGLIDLIILIFLNGP